LAFDGFGSASSVTAFRSRSVRPRRPVIGVLCCNEMADRAVQLVASRFIEPLSQIADATVLLVPALADACDAAALSERLDGLLLTGSRSHVGAHHYGSVQRGDARLDAQRDLVALALAETMIEAGRPVFGICRGLQELNVLFGGTLTQELGDAHHRSGDHAFDELFDHHHAVTLRRGGVLHAFGEGEQIIVNSVHRQGVDRLGQGLRIEAVSPEDGLIEAFSARPCGGEVLAVQWHPEWDGAQGATNRGFFRRIGAALRGDAVSAMRSTAAGGER
jgi:putative glutamine amidotransferase